VKSFKQILSAIFMLFIGIAVANAQTSNGTVVGGVTDSTGGAIVGATVTLTSVDNGAVRTTTTNQDGTYRIESVLPGIYNVSASAAGFQTTVHTGLQITGSSIITSSMVLQVGQTSEKVEVTADNAALNTDNGQLSGTIGEMEISNLPIASLNPYELALTLPGVLNTQVGGFSNGVNFNVGGGRPRANNFLIEGQDNNDAGIQGQGLQPGNDEAVKEVTIIENAYTAEYGHGAGSVSNLIYKSGTNQWHGAVYERLQNSSLDARDHSLNYFQSFCQQQGGTATDCAQVKTLYRENMPGFRIGGPILRNKIFAFASYQWDMWRSTASLSPLTVPTADGIALLNQYAGSSPNVATMVKIYSQLAPASAATGKIALGPDPTTGVDRGTVNTGEILRNLPAQSDSPELDLKADYIATAKDTFTFRYIRTRFTAPFDVFNFTDLLPGFDTNQDGSSHNAGIVETHVFSPNVVNEARLSYGRIGFAFGLNPDTAAFLGTPNTSISGLTGWGIPTNMPQGRFHNTYQLQDTISWTHGKHFFKIGTDLADIRVRDQIPFNFYGSLSFAGSTNSTTVLAPGGGTQSYKYSGLANYMDDFGGANATVNKNFGSPIAQPRLFSQNYFVQDTFRPIPTLSIDLGLRYEFNGAPFNATGTPYPGIDLKNPACFPLDPGANCDTKQAADRKQWGPRAGIAWSPTLVGQHKTVIRSGFGVFYDVVFTNIIDNIQATAPNAASPQLTSSSTANDGRGTSQWLERFNTLNKTPLATNVAEPIVNHLLSPRTLHWNLNVEQELPWSTTLQVGYVGERGEHLYGNTNLNPYVALYELGGQRVIPTRGQIVVRDNSDDSEYTGLWTELDHKFNHNFLFRASYTLGRAFDDGSEIFTTANESSYQFSRYPTPRGTTDWGPSEYDHRHRLVLSYIWQPSVWHTEGAMKVVGNVVNHWAVAGVSQFQSGSTQNVEDGFDVDGDGIGNDRPILGNPKAPLATWAIDNAWFTGVSDGTLCSGPSWWNTSDNCHVVSKDSVHWIVPGFDQHPANPVSRNSMYSPGLQQWDINIQRSFKVTERVTFDFRGELFNAFNHGNFGVENTTLSSGVVTDQFNDFGFNYFADPYSTVTGHRHARIFAKISF
jgi:hypothetical protein